MGTLRRFLFAVALLQGTSTWQVANSQGMQHQGMQHPGMQHPGMQHPEMQPQGMQPQGMQHQGMQQQGMQPQAMQPQAMQPQALQHHPGHPSPPANQNCVGNADWPCPGCRLEGYKSVNGFPTYEKVTSEDECWDLCNRDRLCEVATFDNVKGYCDRKLDAYTSLEMSPSHIVMLKKCRTSPMKEGCVLETFVTMGNDMKGIQGKNTHQCWDMCVAQGPSCVGIVTRESDRFCYLKNKINKIERDSANGVHHVYMLKDCRYDDRIYANTGMTMQV